MRALLFIGLLFFSAASFGQQSAAAMDLAAKYGESANRPAQQMIAGQLLGADPRTIEVFSLGFINASTQILAREYDKQFTQTDLKQINEFLLTPAGQKLFKVNAEFSGKMSTDPSVIRGLVAASCSDAKAKLAPDQMVLLRNRFGCE